MEWSFSKHALRRAVDMALDPEEIRTALEHPTRPLPNPPNPQCHLIHTERLVFVVELKRRRVVTILRNTWDGKRLRPLDRSNDLDYVRDPED